MNISWKSWVFRACVHIRFKPDRAVVQEELLAHLEDKAETILREKDVPVSEAEKQALASMGDADEVGRQLAAVHKPLLGYLWLWSRRALVVCIAMVIWAAFGFPERNDFGLYVASDEIRYWQDEFGGYSNYYDYVEDMTHTELAPDCVDESDGYTFTVPAAAVHRADPSYDEDGHILNEYTHLTLTIQATSRFLSLEGCIPFDDFYAVDDLGNVYISYEQAGRASWNGQKMLGGDRGPIDPWTCRYQAKLTSLDPEASWVEIRYDREGRDIRLRIDLTGGEGT